MKSGGYCASAIIAGLVTDVYVFKQVKANATTRLDLVQSTCNYAPLNDATRSTKGGNFLYLGKDTHSKGESRAGYAITHKIHISGLYPPCVPCVGSPFYWGDMKGTSDALLFDVSGLELVDGKPTHGSTVVVYVARGCEVDGQNICILACDGELDDDMAAARERLQDVTNITL